MSLASPAPSRSRGASSIWTARGLTAYDAAYVALAEAEAVRLVTDDDRILAVAPAVAMSLSGVDRPLAAADPAGGDEGSASPKA